MVQTVHGVDVQNVFVVLNSIHFTMLPHHYYILLSPSFLTFGEFVTEL